MSSKRISSNTKLGILLLFSSDNLLLFLGSESQRAGFFLERAITLPFPSVTRISTKRCHSFSSLYEPNDKYSLPSLLLSLCPILTNLDFCSDMYTPLHLITNITNSQQVFPHQYY